MSTSSPLTPDVPWVELSTTDQDWLDADPVLLRTMLGELHLIRAFEEVVLELAGEGLVHGPAHSSIGQEGGAVGSIVGLRPSDGVNGSHRGHHQFLAKSLTYVSPDGIDPASLVTPAIHDVLRKTLSEILGLTGGYSNGRGGSMHLQWHEAGALGTNAIVGGGVPMGAGNAWAQRHAGTDDVTISYFGDGAVNIGSVLESMNLAAAWNLPFCFFIENNLYAVSTNVDEATGEPRLSGRGPGFGIASWRVDGMDPLAVHLATTAAVEHMRAGRGPAVVEAEVYRFFHQNGPFPGSAFGYRTKEEEQHWRDRDPLDLMARKMIERGLIDDDGIAAVRRQAQDVAAEVAGELTEPDPNGKPGTRRIRHVLWPDPAFVDVGIRSDLEEIAGVRTEEQSTFDGEVASTRMIDAIAEVMDRRMGEDPRIVVLGEDVHRLAGGTNGATKGLAEKYEGRVLGTPISENAFAGLGGGMALDGRFRPVVEFMYPDFLWVAADQVFNQIGKARHMFGGTGAVPLVLRTEGRHRHRLRLAALDGPGRHLRDGARLAHRRPDHAVRLHRADERRPRHRRPGARARARRPVRHDRRRPGVRPGLPAAVRHGRGPPRGPRRHGAHLPVDGPAQPRRGRGVRRRRRGHRPAMARPGLDRLGHDRREHPEDQQRPDRRAGCDRHVVRRLAQRRDPAAVLRLARPAGRTGHRRRRVADHLEGARARRHRRDRGDRRRLRRIAKGLGSPRAEH